MTFDAQLKAAGITPGKPLHTVLKTVHNAALDGQEAAQRQARGMTPEAERALVQSIVARVCEGVELHARQAGRRMAWQAVGLCLAALMLGGGVGWWQGNAGRLRLVLACEPQAPVFGRAACLMPAWFTDSPAVMTRR